TPEELDAVRTVFERLRAGDFPLDFENHWVTKDNRRRLIAWSNTVLTADDGAIEHVIGTGVDITERQLAEQEIRRISSFPLLNPNPVLEVNKAGAVTFCNPSAQRLLEQQGLISDGRWFIPSDWPAIVADLDRRPEGVVRREVAIGQLMFVESIHLAQGFGTIRIFAIDITERKQAEARLRQSNIELQARNAELDAFAHSVAHDLKNPLHIIAGYAELLLLNTDRSPVEIVAALTSILKNVQKINSITDNLMLLSEVRQKAIDLKPIDMAAILGEVWPRMAHLLDGQIELRLPQAWPRVLGYAPWIEQVWVNYASNALKYASRPGCRRSSWPIRIAPSASWRGAGASALPSR
ncbi:partial Alkaline phosphatase synthesis sensor protein PhoR, partial [Planctomycetaceae bacterium]